MTRFARALKQYIRQLCNRQSLKAKNSELKLLMFVEETGVLVYVAKA